MKNKLRQGFAGIEILVVALVVGIVGVVAASLLQRQTSQDSAVLSATVSNWSSTQVFNQDGNSYNNPAGWIGNGQSASQSYLGMIFSGDTIPQGAQITNAKIEFSVPEDYWISVGTGFYGDTNTSPANFSSSNPPSNRSLTAHNNGYFDNVKWAKGQTYSYDVTNIIQELVDSSSRNKIAVVAQGTGDSWGRKFINKDPKLVITYEPSGTSTATPTVTPTPTLTPSPSPTPTKAPTPVPTKSPTPSPSPTPIPTLNVSPTPEPTSSPSGVGGIGGGTTEEIYGAVPASALGNCPESVHDRYVTRGPDGRLYRTWHPTTVPLDPSSPGAGSCNFAHEHGDNPATSAIYKGPVPFSYVGSTVGIDMPHVGYKCYVHNKGLTNDEGSAALHDTYFCFHMGTAGTGRYTARFHELYYYMKTASGYVMNVQGLADTGGNAGTICDNPRHGRTVQGLGCLIDSGYEIWANDFRVRNHGNMVAFAEVSTAVFDPITTMDPNDLTRVLYSWDPEVSQKTFKFGDDHSGFRGCEREAYSGPIQFYNRGGTSVYYTDAYGNVVDGGPIKQEVSAINTNANSGYIDQYGALIMTYKSGNTNDPQSQIKNRKSACVPGLGLLN